MPTGRELCGPSRRFHTLSSLRLHSWSEVDARHLATIIETHDSYFTHNPYDRWFDRLDKVISGANVSYYDPDRSACHLDIVPFATAKKWSDLSTRQRAVLIEASAESLALTLRASTIGTVVLNGISVVRAFEALAGVRFDRDAVPSWTLRRRRTRDVTGIAYKGCVDAMAGVNLGRRHHGAGIQSQSSKQFRCQHGNCNFHQGLDRRINGGNGMLRPGDVNLAERLYAALRTFHGHRHRLPGIQQEGRPAVLIEQMVESDRRVRFVQAIRMRDVSPNRTDPGSSSVRPTESVNTFP